MRDRERATTHLVFLRLLCGDAFYRTDSGGLFGSASAACECLVSSASSNGRLTTTSWASSRILDKTALSARQWTYGGQYCLEQVEQLRQSPDPDPIEVLQAISAFQKYFAAIEKEAVRVARSQNRTWHEIGAALGRAARRSGNERPLKGDEAKAAHWEALGQEIEDSWATSAEVRHKVGLSPPEVQNLGSAELVNRPSRTIGSASWYR